MSIVETTCKDRQSNQAVDIEINKIEEMTLTLTKGKSHCSGARCNIVKATERNARHKARLRTLKKAYPQARLTTATGPTARTPPRGTPQFKNPRR